MVEVVVKGAQCPWVEGAGCGGAEGAQTGGASGVGGVVEEVNGVDGVAAGVGEIACAQLHHGRSVSMRMRARQAVEGS